MRTLISLIIAIGLSNAAWAHTGSETTQNSVQDFEVEEILEQSQQ